MTTMIITGASSGIGRAMAYEAARMGYNIVICARRVDRLQEVAENIRATGGHCAVVVADVSDMQTPQRLVSAALENFGRIDIVANIAGAGAPGPLLSQSDSAIEAQWQQHVAGPIRISRAALPYLRATKGQLMFMGSAIVRLPIPNYGAYALAKAAIRTASTQLRRELRNEGIAVTYIDPGLVDTEFSEVTGVKRANVPFASADTVARRILHGTRTRPARINAVPWQTAFAVFGEWFPSLADIVIQRDLAGPISDPTPKSPVTTSGETAFAGRVLAETAPASKLQTPSDTTVTFANDSDFDKALEPVARRMERVKLSKDFVRSLLVPNTTLTLHDAAIRWAGMPNKNERAAMEETLTALTNAGYLQQTTEENWLVTKSAN